jgi:hypothetical protein
MKLVQNFGMFSQFLLQGVDLAFERHSWCIFLLYGDVRAYKLVHSASVAGRPFSIALGNAKLAQFSDVLVDRDQEGAS